MMIKCRVCDDILEVIESTNEGLFYIEPCPSCVADAVKAVEQPLALDGGGLCAVCGREQINFFGCPELSCESHRK